MPTLKKHFSVNLTVDTIERLKNTVWAESGPPLRLTLSTFVEEALLEALRKIEKSRNSGKPYKQRAAEFVGGRPMAIK